MGWTKVSGQEMERLAEKKRARENGRASGKEVVIAGEKEVQKVRGNGRDRGKKVSQRKRKGYRKGSRPWERKWAKRKRKG
jgi:hypothetical protein